MKINNNISALNAYHQLNKNEKNIEISLKRLSSGLRISNAADDPAGLAISQKMRAQINGLNQASRNTQDGISLIQTAEGALTEIHGILQRMNMLAVQSANDTNTGTDRDMIQQEVNQLAQEITRISNNTTFNSHRLLNGGMTDSGVGKMTLQIGANAGQNHSISIEAMDAKTLGVSGDGASVPYGTNINVMFAGTPSYATDPGEAIKFTFTEGTPFIPATSAQSAEIVSSKSYASDLKTALAAGSSTTSIEKTDGGNIASTISGSPAYAAVDGEIINLTYTQGSPAVPDIAAKPASLFLHQNISSNLNTAIAADSSTTSMVKTDGSNVESTISGTPAFAAVDGETISLTYTQGSPEHLATLLAKPRYDMTKVENDLGAQISTDSDAELTINVCGNTATLNALQLKNVHSSQDLFDLLRTTNLALDVWYDVPEYNNWGIYPSSSESTKGSAAYITITVSGSSAAEKSAIEDMMCMTDDTVTVYGTDKTDYAPAVISALTVSDNHSHSEAYAVNDTDTSFTLSWYFGGLNFNLAAGKTLADLTGNAASTISFNNVTTTTSSDALLTVTVDGASTIITAANMRNYNSGVGVQNSMDLINLLDDNGVNVWDDSGLYCGIESQITGVSSTVVLEVTGSSSLEKEAIKTLLLMVSDSLTIHGQDATIGTPKVDSIVTISDNNSHSQDIVVNDSDTALAGSDYFSGLNISLLSGKTLSDLNGDPASALSFASVTTTIPASDAQLKITVDGTPTIISAADMRDYNSGAGVQSGDDLYDLLQSKGVNVTSGGVADPNWKIQSPDQAASATVRVDVIGSSASEKSAIKALLGISNDSVTVYGQDASSDVPAVSSKVTISDNNGHSEFVLVNDGDLSFTGTGYFSDLSVTLAAGKTLYNLTGDAASTLVIPGGADPVTTDTSSSAQFSNKVLIADATCQNGIDVSTQSTATIAITAISNAINTVSTQRAKLGAYQNSLEHIIYNRNTESQNLTSASSQITDLDMAKEMTTYVSKKILMKAAQAMLAQANQLPQGALSLLMSLFLAFLATALMGPGFQPSSAPPGPS